MVPIPPIPVSPDTLVDVADRLGAIEAVKRKLVKQPDVAAAKLATVLAELSKIFGAMQDEITTYLALSFDDSDPKQLARERATLAGLAAGASRARMEEARGRCNKLWNIYVRYLTPWFDRVLDRDERDELARLFRELSDIDSHMVDALNELAAWLTAEAVTTHELVERDDFEAANTRIRIASREILPLRSRVSDALGHIHRLEAEFIEISGAV